MRHHGPIHIQIVHVEAIVAAGVASLLARHAELVPATTGLAHALQIASGDSAEPCEVLIADHASALRLAEAQGRDRRRARRGPRILALTALEREWDLRVALEAGVHGYLLQRCEPAQLLHAVQALLLGVQYIPAELGPVLASSLKQDRLTRREMEVLRAMSTGASNKDISMILGIADTTVKTHVRAILSKVGACARTEAVAIATRRGLTPRQLQEHAAAPLR